MWWTRAPAAPDAGLVLYKGALAPRAENFGHLTRSGFTLRRRPDHDGTQWGLDFSHPSCGQGLIVCLRDVPLPSRAILNYDPRLTDDERALAASAGSTVTVRMAARENNMLRDRKNLLRVLRAVMGDYGVMAVDPLSQSFWSRDSLDEELAHDADLDVQSLFSIHAVTGDDDKVYWLHTHGLHAIGVTDVDVLRPDPALTSRCFDLVRALAFAVLEGTAKPGGTAFPLAEPDGNLRLVAADTVAKRSGDVCPEWSAELDDTHRTGHAVACDPGGGWRTLFGDRPRPSRYLAGPIPEEILIQFSTSATHLMAQRAAKTYSVFRALVAEFQGLPVPAIAKLGYRVDGGGPDDCEHLWFEVHGCGDSHLDATLVNQPFRIARMKQGERAKHDVALLTDWMILTPFGQINPRAAAPARAVRARKDELRVRP